MTSNKARKNDLVTIDRKRSVEAQRVKEAKRVSLQAEQCSIEQHTLPRALQLQSKWKLSPEDQALFGFSPEGRALVVTLTGTKIYLRSVLLYSRRWRKRRKYRRWRKRELKSESGDRTYGGSCSFSCHSPLCPAPVRPGCLFCLFLSLLSPSSQPPNRPCQSERSSKARHEADSFEPAEWSERLTPGQSGWLGAAAVGSIPALAL